VNDSCISLAQLHILISLYQTGYVPSLAVCSSRLRLASVSASDSHLTPYMRHNCAMHVFTK
jgi:hypothetical protein